MNQRTTGQPLELILARNLVSIISLAALLVDAEGRIVFYNDAAAQLVGEPFEEIGTMTRDEWNARYGPVDEQGRAARRRRAPARGRGSRGAPSVCALSNPRRARAARGRGRSAATARARRISTARWSSSGSPARTPMARADAGQAVGRARVGPGARAGDRASSEGTPHACRSSARTGRRSSSTRARASGNWARRSPVARVRCTSSSPTCTSITSRA